MSNHQAREERIPGTFVARTVRQLSVPIILGWLAITVLVTLAVPSLEQVARDHAVSLGTKDAPSVRAMARIGKVFKESDSDAMAMIVLESDQPLGADAHRYYEALIGQLKSDPKHVQHIQDFWGDPLTAAGAQSADGKAAYVQLNLVGNQGETRSNNSVAAVRKIVDSTPAPKGVKAYVTGPAAIAADGNTSGDKTIVKIMVTTVVVIFVMLLFVYRSFITVALLLAMVGIELAAARGIVAFLALHDVIKLSTFATNMLVSLAIAAGTDYGIFFIGRYHEARHNGEDRKTAYFTAYRGVAHVVLASGLTIAGATYCLSFARLPVFQTLGAPCALGMLVAVAVALTLIPAVIAVGSRFGLLEPKRLHSVRGWRRVGSPGERLPVGMRDAPLPERRERVAADTSRIGAQHLDRVRARTGPGVVGRLGQRPARHGTHVVGPVVELAERAGQVEALLPYQRSRNVCSRSCTSSSSTSAWMSCARAAAGRRCRGTPSPAGRRDAPQSSLRL